MPFNSVGNANLVSIYCTICFGIINLLWYFKQLFHLCRKTTNTPFAEVHIQKGCNCTWPFDIWTGSYSTFIDLKPRGQEGLFLSETFIFFFQWIFHLFYTYNTRSCIWSHADFSMAYASHTIKPLSVLSSYFHSLIFAYIFQS